MDFLGNDPWWFRYFSSCAPADTSSIDFKQETQSEIDLPKRVRTRLDFARHQRQGYGVVTKSELRQSLRAARRAHVAALPETMRGLVFHRPPAPLLELIPAGATIGLYAAGAFEAPTAAYARFFFERGHELALPRFASRAATMAFARYTDPFGDSDCEVGPFGPMQPVADAAVVVPPVLFVPLLGFTAQGDRLGQGGGHYDRWLAAHPATLAIGLAWDCQLLEALPSKPHDRPLAAVVTPTRLYGPF